MAHTGGGADAFDFRGTVVRLPRQTKLIHVPHSQIVERTCDVILGGYAVGRPPPVLPAELVAELSAKADLMA